MGNVLCNRNSDQYCQYHDHGPENNFSYIHKALLKYFILYAKLGKIENKKAPVSQGFSRIQKATI
jgi:hypothetical protein